MDCKIDPGIFLVKWVLPFFIRVLPWATALKVWDIVLLEGQFRRCFLLQSSG